MRVNVRYIVDDVDAAVDFYRDRLGFEVEMHPGPGFAALALGDLGLFLNAPGFGGAGTAGGDLAPEVGADSSCRPAISIRSSLTSKPRTCRFADSWPKGWVVDRFSSKIRRATSSSCSSRPTLHRGRERHRALVPVQVPLVRRHGGHRATCRAISVSSEHEPSSSGTGPGPAKPVR